MMGKIKKSLLLVLVIVICSIAYMKVFSVKKSDIKISDFQNIYNENNITFFYNDKDIIEYSDNLKNLSNTYKINNLVSDNLTEKEKVLKCIEIVNTIVNYDDVSDSISLNAYDILKEKLSNKKVSGRDMAIITRDIINCTGLVARVGEYRKESPDTENKPSYYVIEYWSNEYSKWVMMDFMDAGYFEKDDKPLSAIEVLEDKVSNVIYIGKSTQKEFKKKIKPYLSSYTISIDNTLNMKKSNSYVTYITSVKDITIKKGDKYNNPTIYTENKDIFNNDPYRQVTDQDSKAYLIVMKKPIKEIEENPKFVIAGFKDGTVIRSYYVKVNDEAWENVDMYKEIDLQKGKSKIQLSLDGNNVVSELEIVRDK